MVEILGTFIITSAVIFFGFFAEFLFQKLKIPDVLLLILFGLALGPYGLKYINPSSLSNIAPIFTAFALLFLLFDSAFNIDLVSFFRGLGKGMSITVYNFAVSSITISLISMLFGFDLLHALLIGFILGGVSSAFVIPVIKNLKIKKETYSILTLESAITDVLCIVFALTAIQIIKLNNFSFNFVASKLAALFAVAGFFGVIAGVIWIVIVSKILKKNKSYMLTIAYLLLLYTVTEYLNGNGAIATLFFGLVLRNSKKLTALIKGENAISVTSLTEQLFYSQISFFLKTFFFVYIGILLDFSNLKALIIGAIMAIAIMLLRNTTSFIAKNFMPYDKKIMNSIFARGLAAAVLAQLAIQHNLQNAELIAKITFSVIMFTIIFSSVRIFLVNKEYQSPKAVTKT
ncbi:cation:proton antiporter [Candidatus Woesearchaeota archaeon]|nr:cation:proton antiporter [Candidatus Woesearchaeota archaeon]